MERIRAAGAVLWRRTDRLRIAVVHRPRYDDWSLPKGKLDCGETVQAAAVRELAEETGYRAVLGRLVRQVRYPLPSGAEKVVDFFAARALSGDFAPNDEVDALRWVTPDEAMALLDYPDDVAVVKAADPLETSTLLLVRHAHAGKKALWEGPDELRPLSSTGVKQARRLAALLPLFGVDTVYSAPRTRCVQTVKPLALPVALEPTLTEEAYRDAPKEALERLREIASSAGVAAVCSQGKVIPHLVAALSEESAVEVGKPISRKGSVWVMSFAGDGALAGADYIPA